MYFQSLLDFHHTETSVLFIKRPTLKVKGKSFTEKNTTFPRDVISTHLTTHYYQITELGERSSKHFEIISCNHLL